MTDLSYLIENAIPEGRQSLESGYANLERIAAYCEANYIQDVDKKAALDETKRLTVQSLASVAYQINALASNVLNMLDLQADRVSDMELQLNNISQIVDIHKEKVARREIGVLTTNKPSLRFHKIVTPAHQEKPQTYTRRHIDYSILDDLGHGVKTQMPSNPRLITRTGSTVSSGSSGANTNVTTADLVTPAIYLSAGLKTGTVSRGAANKEYRTPVTVAPPTAPVMQSLEFVQQRYPGMVPTNNQGNQWRSGNCSISSGTNYGILNIPSIHSTVNRAVDMPSHQIYQKQFSEDFLPASLLRDADYSAQNSPPLPPPPSSTEDQISGEFFDSHGTTLERDDGGVELNAIWIPQNHIEKVLAIYDYQAEKPDELSFYENQVIYVMKKNEDGWFEGVLNGVTGLFPGNYVEHCL